MGDDKSRPSDELEPGKHYEDAFFVNIDLVGHSRILHNAPRNVSEQVLDLFETWTRAILEQTLKTCPCTYARFWGWQGDGGTCVFHDRLPSVGAKSAVQFGKALLSALDGLNRNLWKVWPAPPLSLKVGVDTGSFTCKAAPALGSIHSGALNFAVHLQARTPANTMAVSEGVYAQLRRESASGLERALPDFEERRVYVYWPRWNEQEVLRQWRLWAIPRAPVPRHTMTAHMHDDIQQSEEVLFVGVSHEHLKAYLEETIARATAAGMKLPWHKIIIYFASEASGRFWAKQEGYDFGRRVYEVKGALVDFLGGQGVREVAPRFREALLYQMSLPSFVGMCACRYAGCDPGEYSVIYVSQYFAKGPHDLRDALTTRVESIDKSSHSLFAECLSALRETRLTSRLIGTAEHDSWNASAEKWDQFIQAYPHIYQESMRVLAEFAGIEPQHHVLDVGCASGRTSMAIAETVEPPGGRLALLDSSPNMIGKARDLLVNYPSVQHYVAKGRDTVEYVLDGARFDRILFHFAFPLIFRRGESPAEALLFWCRFLRDRGEIVAAIHNSFLESEMPRQFSDWVDPFRAAMEAGIRAAGCKPRAADRKWTLTEIDELFVRCGFRKVNLIARRVGRTMEDRYRMWQVAAVRDSLFPDDINDEERDRIVREAYEQCRNAPTAPTIITYLRYSFEGYPSVKIPLAHGGTDG